jgi:hypothetical protein
MKGSAMTHKNLQYNLPLATTPPATVPDNKQKELVHALVELLVNAAHQSEESPAKGGDDEFEAHE